jgi:nitrate reductase alpha subunit
LARYRDVEKGDWKFLIFDGISGQPRMPKGSVGFRWQKQEGQWNLELKDGLDGAGIDPRLSLIDGREDVLQVSLMDFGGGRTFRRGVPIYRDH